MVSPYYSQDGITIYNADNVAVMRSMESETVDLVVTSPPYGNLRNYGESFAWDFRAVANELCRLLKKCGVIVWIVNDQTINGSESGTSFRQALYFMECGLRLHDTMIYAKDASAFPEKVRYYPLFEYMFVFSKGRPKSINLIADKKNIWSGSKPTGTDRQKNGATTQSHCTKKGSKRRVREFSVRGNIWNYSPGYMKSTVDKVAYGHPAIFPEALAYDHIISWSNEGDTVLDPFNGSGTTTKMCAKSGRVGIGIDLEGEYCDIAVERLSKAELV